MPGIRLVNTLPRFEKYIDGVGRCSLCSISSLSVERTDKEADVIENYVSLHVYTENVHMHFMLSFLVIFYLTLQGMVYISLQCTHNIYPIFTKCSY